MGMVDMGVMAGRGMVRTTRGRRIATTRATMTRMIALIPETIPRTAIARVIAMRARRMGIVVVLRMVVSREGMRVDMRVAIGEETMGKRTTTITGLVVSRMRGMAKEAMGEEARTTTMVSVESKTVDIRRGAMVKEATEADKEATVVDKGATQADRAVTVVDRKVTVVDKEATREVSRTTTSSTAKTRTEMVRAGIGTRVEITVKGTVSKDSIKERSRTRGIGSSTTMKTEVRTRAEKEATVGAESKAIRRTTAGSRMTVTMEETRAGRHRDTREEDKSRATGKQLKIVGMEGTTGVGSRRMWGTASRTAIKGEMREARSRRTEGMGSRANRTIIEEIRRGTNRRTLRRMDSRGIVAMGSETREEMKVRITDRKAGGSRRAVMVAIRKATTGGLLSRVGTKVVETTGSTERHSMADRALRTKEVKVREEISRDIWGAV